MDKNYFWLQEAFFLSYWFLVRQKLTLYLSSIALRVPDVPQWKGGLNVVWKTEVRLNRTLIISWNDIGLKKEPEKDIENILVRQLDPRLVLVVHCHRRPRPPVRQTPHPLRWWMCEDETDLVWIGSVLNISMCIITDSLNERDLNPHSWIFATNLQVHVHDSSIESCLSEERNFVARRSIVVPI